MTMFTLFLMTRASEVDGLFPTTVGWIVIAIAWSVVGALWMTGSFLTQRASQSPGPAPQREAPEVHSN